MAKRLELAETLATSPYLIFDSTFLIHEYHEHSILLASVPAAQRRTSVLSLWEFLHGSAGHVFGLDERRERRDWLEENGIRALPISQSASTTFRALLMLEESPPGVVDCLLAAECKARGIPLVTHDTGFENVDALRLVFLATPAP